MKDIATSVFGKTADEIANSLGLKMDGDSIDVTAKVKITYRSVEGHQKIAIVISELSVCEERR